jgi:hypothetical protein
MLGSVAAGGQTQAEAKANAMAADRYNQVRMGRTLLQSGAVPGLYRLTLGTVIAWAAITLAPTPARAGDGSLVWKTIETEHFAVHYYEPLGDVAHRVAVVAERSHRVLVPALRHTPREKTHIVLVDDTDGANGFANVVPRNAIRLFATAPTGISVLNDHDDWLYGLVAHEYTHVLHLDTIEGLPRLYNRIFGKVWAPNQIQPRWVIEGIATYQESRRSSGGRTRSALFDMYLRVAVLAGAELELDALCTGPRAWPHGTAPYLYGSHFLEYIFNRFGEDKLAVLSRGYGSDPIPFGLNKQIERAVDHSFVELYEDWRDHMRAEFGAELEAIDRHGRREGRRLTFQGEGNTNPAFTADGRHVVWYQSDGKSDARFRRMPIDGNITDADDYGDVDRAGGFDLLRDGRMVVEQTTNFRTNYDYQDLRVYDPRTGNLSELTRGRRARDPAVSPDERWVAFALTGESRSRLAVMPLREQAEHRILWEGAGRYDQVTAPAWSPDGRTIAFSAWRTGGYRDILVVDVATGRVTELMHDRAIDADPVFSPDGRYLYYSSDRSGVYNVYAHELATGRLRQVTNVVGGALLPDVSPDGTRLVYMGYAVGGFELYELALVPERWLEPEVYIDDRPAPTVVDDGEAVVSAPRPYRPLETLAPQSYTLQLVTDSFGNAVSVTTGGSDIVGHHGYDVGATASLERGHLGVAASYAYTRRWPAFRLSVNRNVSRPAGFRIGDRDTRYTEVGYGATARVSLPVLRTASAAANVSFDYDIDWFQNVDDDYDGYDPNAPVPTGPETDAVVAGLGVSWSYSDTRGFTWTLGPQEGRSFAASLRLDHPSLGSDFRRLSLSYRWNGYYKLPFAETSVVALRLAGGIATTDRRRSGVFVLGGVPDQDIIASIRNSTRAGIDGYLRGYEPRSVFGRTFHLLNLEYRQILVEVEHGLATLPVYLRRVHVAGLFDLGNAYDGGFELGELKPALGAAVRTDVVFGYFAPGSFDIGYARGLTEDGQNEFWLLLTGTL